ncbi:hypothetical protein ACFL4T_01420 [candidate division KSB1 bacterium]
MKKFVITLIVLIFSISTFAQRDETLLGDRLSFGGYGGPVVQITQIGGETGVMVGGKGGWIIKQKDYSIIIGGGGYGLVNNIRADIFTEELYYNLGYGGLIFEFVSKPHKLRHHSFSLLIGGGGLSFREKGDFGDNFDDDADAFFILEPGINYVVNITRFFRVGLGLSYRMISGLNKFDVKNEDLSGVSGVIEFKFGSF